MKSLLMTLMTLLTFSLARADVLSCSMTVVQGNGVTLDSSVQTSFPSFFQFDIDPRVGSGEAWQYQNLCLTKKDIAGARFRGSVCALVMSSGPWSGTEKLLVSLIHFLPGRQNVKLSSLSLNTTRATDLELPFPPPPFKVSLNAQSDGISFAELNCSLRS